MDAGTKHPGDTQARKDATEKSLWLDVLRGLAIFGVVAVHSMLTTDAIVLDNKSEVFSRLIYLGKYGVELFFFLSGWLLASIYGQQGKRLGKNYWARRVGRIYPLWLLFLFIGFLRWEFTNYGNLAPPNKAIEGQSTFLHSTPGVLLLTLSFTLFVSASLWNGVIPGGWSIQAEVAHYLIFPIIRNRSLNTVLKVAAFVNFLTSITLFTREKLDSLPIIFLKIIDAWFRLSLYSTFGYFLIGILGFTIFSQVKKSQTTDLKFSDLKISHNTIIVFSLSLLIIPCPFGDQIEAIGYLTLMVVISFAILRNQKLSTGFRFLGRHAYFIYFMHFLALESVEWFVQSTKFTTSQLGSQQLVFLLIFLYSLTISSLLAWPSMKYFERPILGMAHKVK
jgi:peptidoglycan/LPS O-acetylase OafA/YrhL